MSQSQTIRKYNATFILDTRGAEEEVEKLTEKLKALLESLGGSVGKFENHGIKEFSRVTDRKHTADFYLDVDFDAPADGPGKLQELLHLEKNVKRVLVRSR